MVLHPITGTLETDDIGMVNNPIDHRRRHRRVTENIAPPTKSQIARQDQRRLFIPARDELEEQIRGVLIEWDVADLVNDQDAVAAEPLQFRVEFPPRVSLLEAVDPPDSGIKKDPVAGLGGLDAETDREVRFPGPGRPQQDHVLALGQEHPGAHAPGA